MEQENNFNKIESLIEKETSIIEKLHTDIDTYKINLDANIEKFKVNKEKLLTMIEFIVDTKNYIKDIELASTNVKNKSKSIFDVSKTIKKIADNNRLLSINAQIESAKSNLTNNGFSVISDEMVKMSDNTRRNSVLIDEIIDEVLKDIEKLNESVIFNSKKIEESISLCSIIAEFIESLFEEQSLNIKMFDSILSSMEEMIYYIEETRVCISAGNYLTAEVFNNTATEYYMIDSLIKESLKYKNELNEIVKNNNVSISDEETINILTKHHRDYNYDPLEYAYEHEVALCRNIHKTLFVESENGTIMPSIAKGWTDIDKKEWTIYLKDNIVFSNGDKVTAEDVEFSLIRAYNFDKTGLKQDLRIIENKASYGKDKVLVDKLSGIKIVNNRTIKIILNEPSNSILSMLTAMSSCIISKKEYLKNKSIIGAGAYYINKIETLPDSSSVVCLRVNPYMSNSVYIKNICLNISKDYDNIIKNNELEKYDIIDKLPCSKLNELSKNNPSYDLHSINSYALIFLTFNTSSRNSLMSDKGFRQFLLSKLKDVDLSIPDSKDILIRYRGLSSYWCENDTTIWIG